MSTEWPCKGMTLVEVLVAIFILSILSVLCWQAVDGSQRIHDRARQLQKSNINILSLLDQLATDISNHALLASPYPDSSGQLSSPMQSILPESIQWDDSRLTVLQLDRAGQLNATSWHIQDKNIVRTSSPLEQNQARAPTVYRYGPITGWRIRPWIPRRGWMQLPDVPAGLRATGIEIVLDTEFQGKPVSYRKVVLLP